jgi:1-acyl-sn-glycerol-3-phosphate acyltransferase
LSLFGWKVVGSFPDLPKALIIVAPHTSNWDFIAGFWAYLALDLHANWFGKHTLFVWPFGVILRRFGGIPVHRESRVARQVVDVYVEAYQSRDRMLLAIAPEGTRRRVEEWKSGFHRIALGAGVPIVRSRWTIACRGDRRRAVRSHE